MKEKDLLQLLSDIYKEAKKNKFDNDRIVEGFKKFVYKLTKVERGMLNNVCGLKTNNSDIDELAINLVILYDRQYEQEKEDIIKALKRDTTNKKEEEEESAWGFLGIFLPFFIGGAIGLFLEKNMEGFITWGLCFYFPIVAALHAGFVGFIIALVAEWTLYYKIPNDILKLAVFIVPSAGAFIFQVVDYVKKKSIREKAEKENVENIEYVKNDYNEVNTQDKINGSEQLKLEGKEIKKNNNSLLYVIIIIALLIGGAYAYSYFHTLSNNWHWKNGGYCYVDKNGNLLKNTMINERFKTYYVDANGKMAEKTWVEYEGNLYYFNDNGVMEKDKVIFYNKDAFLVDKDGKLLRDTYNTDKKGITRYFGVDGKMVKDVITPDGRKANKYGIIN